MRRPTVVLAAAITWLVLPLACRRTEIAVYEPVMQLDTYAADLAPAEDGFRLLRDESTVGRFVCPIAIAKLVPQAGANGWFLQFVPSRPAEQAQWNEALRGVRQIQDVRYIRPMTTRPEGQELADLLDAARIVGARLLLIYMPNRTGPNSARVVGVLYDVPERAPLATLHAAARFLTRDAPGEVAEEESPDDERGDLRPEDAYYQAQRAFERHTLACLRELIHRDQPPATTQPHRWRQPPLERWWINYR